MEINKKELTYRMYGWVNYQLSGIQSGIQYGHAVVEYGNSYFETDEYQKWAKVDKTFIVLNGGITNDNIVEYGMLSIVKKLLDLGVKFATFREPDLNNTLTSICLLVDERVFDSVNYPITEETLLSSPMQVRPVKSDLKDKFGSVDEGLKIYELRKFLQSFRLA